MTYLCEHAGLGVQVALKEYLPNEIAVRDGAEVHPKSTSDREGYEWGLGRLMAEARTLARFKHPNVVRVSGCFEANNTAYIVMDYEDGEALDALLQRHGTLTEAQLKRVVLPLADGLRQVHAAGFLHRDVKPANIFVRRSDESPVLLDFGSARQALGRRSRSVTAIASAGYSPPEQYESDGSQGPWTDIYALSALCYRAVTGEVPMEAPRRQNQLLRTQTDPLPHLAEFGGRAYSSAFLDAVDWGLRLMETERPQSVDDWLARVEEISGAVREPASRSSLGSRDQRTRHWGRGRSRYRAPRSGPKRDHLPSAKGRLLGPTEYLRLFWTGQLGLGWTFWILGVAGSGFLGLGLAVLFDAYRYLDDGQLLVVPIAPSAMSAGPFFFESGRVHMWAGPLFLWSLVVKPAIWRAAKNYSGPRGWAVMAKFYVLADALVSLCYLLYLWIDR